MNPGGPAADAGMQVGEVILSVAGRPTRTTDDLSAALATLKPGQKVALVVERQDGHRQTLHVTLGRYPGS